jgi:hypothetical protein
MEAVAKVDTVYLLENGKIRKADQEIRPDIEINQAKSA